jgi:hypothetical protein
MKSVTCCFLLLTAGLCAQSTDKLNSDLVSLANPGASRNDVTQQVTNDILALAEKDAQPSWLTVFEFADELTKSLAARPVGPQVKPLPKLSKPLLIEPPLQRVTQAILDVLQSSGVTSYRFHDAVERFRNALIALNATAAQAKSAADRLFILGQEVRGPEDIKLNSL